MKMELFTTIEQLNTLGYNLRTTLEHDNTFEMFFDLDIKKKIPAKHAELVFNNDAKTICNMLSKAKIRIFGADKMHLHVMVDKDL